MSVTREDIERWYSNPAVATVRAPLDPGELDSMEERALYARMPHPPDDDPRLVAHFITLLRPWRGVLVEGVFAGVLVALEPGEYRVASFGADPDHVIVHASRGKTSLVHSL